MRLTIALVLLVGAAIGGNASDPTPAQVDDIVAKFAAKESEFARARGNYTYRQRVKLVELDEGGNVIGKHEITSDIIFTPKRTEKVVYAPMDSLKNLLLTPEDEQDLRDIQPFVLTSDEVGFYNVRFLGREKLDEISCYSFAVKPKKLDKGKRYFEGVVWVDDQDLQIVKSYGRAVGLLKRGADNQFPKFETYREQIDGKYWFPTYTIANDTLVFKDLSQKIRMTVKYEDYKQFKADTIIKYDVDEPKKDDPEKKPPPKKQ